MVSDLCHTFFARCETPKTYVCVEIAWVSCAIPTLTYVFWLVHCAEIGDILWLLAPCHEGPRDERLRVSPNFFSPSFICAAPLWRRRGQGLQSWQHRHSGSLTMVDASLQQWTLLATGMILRCPAWVFVTPQPRPPGAAGQGRPGRQRAGSRESERHALDWSGARTPPPPNPPGGRDLRATEPTLAKWGGGIGD